MRLAPCDCWIEAAAFCIQSIIRCVTTSIVVPLATPCAASKPKVLRFARRWINFSLEHEFICYKTIVFRVFPEESMRHFTSFVLIGSVLTAVGIPAIALAAPAEVAIRPQTTETPVVQSSSSGNPTNSTIIDVAVTAANDKNFKNCGKGNNDNTGRGTNGTNNGNCRASP